MSADFGTSAGAGYGGIPLDSPLSKMEYVVLRLRRDIVSGEFKKGQPLGQTELAARYGVSPTPVREALRLLAAEGLISYLSHRGATVVGLSADSLRDLYAVRAQMEGFVTGLAAERLTDDEIDEIGRLHELLIAARADHKEVGEIAALNWRLHFSIYDHTSPIISNQIRQLRLASPQFDPIWESETEAERLIREHGEIVDLLRKRDAVGARELMVEHVVGSAAYRESSL